MNSCFSFAIPSPTTTHTDTHTELTFSKVGKRFSQSLFPYLQQLGSLTQARILSQPCGSQGLLGLPA